MRKNLFLAITMAVVIASCGNKNQQGNYENDVIDVNELSTTDKTKYGIVGAGTTMNQLQMINDNGDTLSVAISAAKEKQQMLGGLSQGDRIAVMIAEENGQKVATEVVNLNSLLGHWIMPNPMDGSDYVGMTIKEGGIAESINQSSTFYKTWRIFNGKLILVADRDGGGDLEETDTFSILSLGADSLIIQSSEDKYEYARSANLPQMTYEDDDTGL